MVGMRTWVEAGDFEELAVDGEDDAEVGVNIGAEEDGETSGKFIYHINSNGLLMDGHKVYFRNFNLSYEFISKWK